MVHLYMRKSHAFTCRVKEHEHWKGITLEEGRGGILYNGGRRGGSRKTHVRKKIGL